MLISFLNGDSVGCLFAEQTDLQGGEEQQLQPARRAP